MKNFFLLFLITLSGCTVHVVHRQALPPIKVAVLPMANETTNLEGPNIVREKFHNTLMEIYGYIPQPLGDVDAKLKEMGITDGGQLNAVTAQDLGKKLEVDAVIYCKLITFKPVRVTLGDVVKANFRMVDCNTGQAIWEKEEGVGPHVRISKDETIGSYLTKLGRRAVVEKVIRIPLEQETNILVRRVIRTIPER